MFKKLAVLCVVFAALPVVAQQVWNGSRGIPATNAGSIGTTQYKLVKYTGAPSTAIITATTDTQGSEGICDSNCGTSGSAYLMRWGLEQCVFDGGTTAGDYIQISSTVAGDCHDYGSGYPSSGQVIGRVLSTNGSTGTYYIDMYVGGQASGTGGGGSLSVNGSGVSSPNFNGTTPAAGTGMLTGTFQVSSSSVSVETPNPGLTSNMSTSVQTTSCSVDSNGSGSGGLLQSSDNVNAKCLNSFGGTLTVVDVKCEGDTSDTLSVQLYASANGFNGGSALLSGGCMPGNQTRTTCTLVGSPTIPSGYQVYSAISPSGSPTMTKAYCQIDATKP